MRYCGVAAGPGSLLLCALSEERAPEPPVRLIADFYEPGSADEVAAELRSLEEVVVAIGAPTSGPREGRPSRICDAELARRGVPPHPPVTEALRLTDAVADRGVYAPASDSIEGTVEEGAFHAAPVFETNPDAVFCALEGRRVPARRHPLGIQRRIQELVEDHVIDEGGDLWHRRIEEIEAAAAALAAHRFAVGHACWLGEPEEGVIVLPGSRPPEAFPGDGVLPDVRRLPLERA